MWFLTEMPLTKRTILLLAAVASALTLTASPALASTSQVSIIEDDAQMQANPGATLQTMKDLGAGIVKVSVAWKSIAPDPNSSRAPRNFNAADPSAYPAANWGYLDTVVTDAARDGLRIGLMVTRPVPRWAEGPGLPARDTAGNWKPSPAAFAAFMHAIGERYDGRYTPIGSLLPLPRVNWWSIWNEPNYGPDLAPQAIDGNRVDTAAIEYRALVDGAWAGLTHTGHVPSRDTILIGETAPRGVVGGGQPGTFGGTVPLSFLRALYCAAPNNARLTGSAARAQGCPPSPAAFRARNPALFAASGYADHPYAQGTPPNIPTYACRVGGRPTFCWSAKSRRSDPEYADLAEIGRLQTTLDHLQGAYGSHSRLAIWNTEFGYWTNPPDSSPALRREVVSPATAALYMNWAEYLSYENSRIASYAQYLIVDSTSNPFSSGLELSDGRPLATFSAFQMPLFMPTTRSARPSQLTVWGLVRPAPYALVAAPAEIQFQAAHGGLWRTVAIVPLADRRGYFDVKAPFDASGSVRIAWPAAPGRTLYSRTQAITVK